MITKDTLWSNYQGNVKPLNELEDSHLTNIIVYVNELNMVNKEQIESVCLEILKDRGIEVNAKDLVQVPHVNNDGDLIQIDYDKMKIVKLNDSNED